MKNTDNIEKMEKILNDTASLMDDADRLMDRLEENLDSYKELSDYYCSDERMKDLEDDEKGLIPDNINRGVLDEDSIWNLGIEYREAAMRMMEIGLRMLRNS